MPATISRAGLGMQQAGWERLSPARLPLLLLKMRSQARLQLLLLMTHSQARLPLFKVLSQARLQLLLLMHDGRVHQRG
jgi:hypothetical protein